MIIDAEMTDTEVADQIARADRFIADFREMIAATVVDPASASADYQRRGLRRIADTLDAVPYVTFCNLANLDAALRGGLNGPDRATVVVCRCWPDTGLRERDSISRRVRPRDREGAQAATAMMSVDRGCCVASVVPVAPSTAICSGLPRRRGPAILSRMGTKSRETIYGASVRAAAGAGEESTQGSRPARRRGVEQAHARLSGSGAAIARARGCAQCRIPLPRSPLPWLQHASERCPRHRAATEGDVGP